MLPEPPAPIPLLFLPIVLWKTTRFHCWTPEHQTRSSVWLSSESRDSSVVTEVHHQDEWVANCQKLNVDHFVRVRATIGDLHVRLFMRMIDTPLPIVLGYPFLHQFNMLINWKHRTGQIIHQETSHIIPLVKAYGSQHQLMSVDSVLADLHAVQSQSEYIQQLPPPKTQHVMAQKALLVKMLSDAAVLPNKNTINSAGYYLPSAVDAVV